MPKPAIAVETRVLHERFGRFAAAACMWLGSTWAFLGAGTLVIGWVLLGFFFHFSATWVQIIDTFMTLTTFLMVFLIQNTQNRDARAVNLKLNELIRAIDKARDQMIDIERLTDIELDEMAQTYERIKNAWMERQKHRQPEAGG